MGCGEDVSVADDGASAHALIIDLWSVVRLYKALPRPGMRYRYAAADNAGHQPRRCDLYLSTACYKYVDRKRLPA